MCNNLAAILVQSYELKWKNVSYWFWSAWVQSCFYFIRSIQYTAGGLIFFIAPVSSASFVCLLFLYSLEVEEKCRTASSVSGLMQCLQDIQILFLTIYCCCTLHTYQCIAVIVDCSHVHHVVHYK